jgi:hypothetical protein
MKPLIDRITQGPVAMHPQFFTVIDQQKAHVADCDGTHEIDDETRRANAEFIAEAFTVAQETGMTPRQMAEKLKNAEEAFKGLLDTVVGFGLADKHAPVRCDLEKLGAILDPARFSPPQGTVFALPPNPQPVLPPGLPPLPPGTRYGGQLKDRERAVRGHVFAVGDHEWTQLMLWSGFAGCDGPEKDPTHSGHWHLAIPLDA